MTKIDTSAMALSATLKGLDLAAERDALAALIDTPADQMDGAHFRGDEDRVHDDTPAAPAVLKEGTDPAPDRFAAMAVSMEQDFDSAMSEASQQPEVQVRFTWASEDKEFWLHMKLPDGTAAGINLGNPTGMIATACLRALVEKGRPQ